MGRKELFTKELWGLAHGYQQNWENMPVMEPEGAGPGKAGCGAGDNCNGTLADDSGFNILSRAPGASPNTLIPNIFSYLYQRQFSLAPSRGLYKVLIVTPLVVSRSWSEPDTHWESRWFGGGGSTDSS